MSEDTDSAALTNLLQKLYDPTSARFHRYLTTSQFAEQFKPTPADYQVDVFVAKSSGLIVTGTHPNRMLLNVEGTVANVEATFHVSLKVQGSGKPLGVKASPFHRGA